MPASKKASRPPVKKQVAAQKPRRALSRKQLSKRKQTKKESNRSKEALLNRELEALIRAHKEKELRARVRVATWVAEGLDIFPDGIPDLILAKEKDRVEHLAKCTKAPKLKAICDKPPAESVQQSVPAGTRKWGAKLLQPATGPSGSSAASWRAPPAGPWVVHPMRPVMVDAEVQTDMAAPQRSAMANAEVQTNARPSSAPTVKVPYSDSPTQTLWTAAGWHTAKFSVEGFVESQPTQPSRELSV